MLNDELSLDTSPFAKLVPADDAKLSPMPVAANLEKSAAPLTNIHAKPGTIVPMIAAAVKYWSVADEKLAQLVGVSSILASFASAFVCIDTMT